MLINLTKNNSLFKSVLICLLMLSCSEWDSVWDLDDSYSVELILSTQKSLDAKLSDTVDVIQIYRVSKEGKDKIFPLKVLRHKPLIYEFREKEDIKKYFELSREIITPPVEGCSSTEAKEVFHVIAYDHTLKRIGYIRYYPCVVNGVEYGMLRPSGDYGVFDNKELPKNYPLLTKR